MVKVYVKNLGGTDKVIDAAEVADVPTKAGNETITGTWTFNANAAGVEGGEIHLSKPPSGSTLAADVNVDIYTNSFRVFENGGSARGFNVDLTECAAGATTALSLGLSKVVTFTRDLSAATGNVAYTGVGFKPSCMIGLAHVNTTATFTAGMVGKDGVGGSVDYYGNNLVTSQAAFLQIQLADGTAAKYQSAAVNSFDSDGFTLAWTKTGLPTGTATIYVLCLR